MIKKKDLAILLQWLQNARFCLSEDQLVALLFVESEDGFQVLRRDGGATDSTIQSEARKASSSLKAPAC